MSEDYLMMNDDCDGGRFFRACVTYELISWVGVIMMLLLGTLLFRC